MHQREKSSKNVIYSYLSLPIVIYHYLSLSIVIYRARINSIIDTIVGKSQRVCGCFEELDS